MTDLDDLLPPVATGYFHHEEVSSDVAPRIVELASAWRAKYDRYRAVVASYVGKQIWDALDALSATETSGVDSGTGEAGSPATREMRAEGEPVSTKPRTVDLNRVREYRWTDPSGTEWCLPPSDVRVVVVDPVLEPAKPRAPRIMPYAERAPLYAAYRAARTEAARLGLGAYDDRIVQAAVRAFEAAKASDPAADPRCPSRLAVSTGAVIRCQFYAGHPWADHGVRVPLDELSHDEQRRAIHLRVWTSWHDGDEDTIADGQPRTWALPDEPGSDVTAVRTNLGTLYVRSPSGRWVAPGGHPGSSGFEWRELVPFGLTDASGETP